MLELIRDYPQVEVFGEIDMEPQEMKLDKRCPICGYPLQLRYKKAYGLKLWIYANEPEICDFMANNLVGEEMTIMKCDKYKDGYLIVKDGRGSGPFLGCTTIRQIRRDVITTSLNISIYLNTKNRIKTYSI